jgi:hypothetical protein
MAPDDDELLRFILDEEPLRAETQEHLRQCEVCRQRLVFYKETNAFLVSRLYRSQCPDATALNLFCAHMLPVDEVMKITGHLKECPLCNREVQEIRQILADFDPFPVPPSPREALRGFVERIVATLVPWQPQFVTRSALHETPTESSWPRQYRAGSLNISLHLSRTSYGEAMILGLFSSVDPNVSSETFEGGSVSLYTAALFPSAQEIPVDPPLLEASIDDLGNVVLKPVPTGEYVMVVTLPENEVVIPALSIPAS